MIIPVGANILKIAIYNNFYNTKKASPPYVVFLLKKIAVDLWTNR